MAISQNFPTVDPTLRLNFQGARTLDPRITFTRSSIGTYVDEDGLIKTAAADQARFDYDPETGESLGLLIEERRTNEILNSQVFTSGYNQSGLNLITQNTTVTTPEGLTDGVGVITESSGGTVHQFYEASSAQITGIRTYSIFVKPNGRNYCVLMTSSFTHDLVNATTLGSASGEYESATTTKFANGWVRCTVTVNHSNSFDQFNFKLAKDGHQNYSYSGDGTSGVYVWGAQIELGSFPTSYIPTSGSTVTRNADTAQITGTNFSSWFNQSEGSLFLSADIGDTSVPNQSYISVENSSSTDNFLSMGYRVGGGGSGYLGSWYLGDLVTKAFFNHNASISSNAPFKQIFAYKTNDFAGSVNGQYLLTDTDGLTYSSFDRLRFGQYYYGDTIDTGHIKQLIYYPERLTNEQLQNLTK